MDAQITDLPKAELHCHLDGVLDAAMLRTLRSRDIDLPVTPEALEAMRPVRDFDSFVAWFDAQQPLAGRLDLYRHVACAHVARLKAQRVVYAELFVGSIPRDVEQALDQLAALRAAIGACEQGEIQVELVAAWGRNRGLDGALQLARRNIALFEAGLICGVAVAGPEQGFPIAPLANALDEYAAAGIPIEIHAAEWCGPESAWDALEHGHPRRIGHGTHVFEDPRLVEALVARRVHVEMCPTSNVLTGSIAQIEDHPIRRAFDAGVDVSVNTDDPGAFGCSMTSEHALLSRHFGFTPEELLRLGANAVRARFQPHLRVPAAQALAQR